MSRSRRNTPVSGIAVCRSERKDKKMWHTRWRTTERMALRSASPEELSAHLPVLEREVSNVWAMGKDGHTYRPLARQDKAAEHIANRIGRNPQERASLKKRLLKKWMGK